MTPEQRDELRRLCAATTAGGWRKQPNTLALVCSDAENCIVAQCGDYKDKELRRFNGARWNADAAFIAASRQAVPELLDEVEKLDWRLRMSSTARMDNLTQELAASDKERTALRAQLDDDLEADAEGARSIVKDLFSDERGQGLRACIVELINERDAYQSTLLSIATAAGADALSRDGTTGAYLARLRWCADVANLALKGCGK